METDFDPGGGGAEDYISRLPDEVLHSILLCLPSTAAAARTSLLSRRWRRVWAHIPELVLGSYGPPPARSPLLDPVDAALDAYAAPTVRQLKVDLNNGGETDIPAQRFAPWLRFASQRLAGRLELSLPHRDAERWEEEMEEIFLPLCEKTTEIKLFLAASFVLRPPPTGSFRALIKLTIRCATLDGNELGRVVSLQCPCLQLLSVVVRLVRTFEVSICSKSLKKLIYYARARHPANNTSRLEVSAPWLAIISVSRTDEAYIIAPKLQKVTWGDDPYDPNRHQLVVAGRHLKCLSIKESSMKLMQQFDTISELSLNLSIPRGIERYVSLLKDTDRLPLFETLCITTWSHHALVPTIFHLLTRCSGIRKLKLCPIDCPSSKDKSCTTLGCPCLQESYRVGNVTFDSLEEIKMFNFKGSAAQEEFIKFLLSRCNAKTLRRVHLIVERYPISSAIKAICERIRSMCGPDIVKCQVIH